MIFKIALRNIFRQKRRSWLTMTSMTFGFALGALSIAMTYGGFGNIIDAFTRAHTGHIQVHREGYLDRPSIYKTIENATSVMDSLNAEYDIDAMAPRVLVSGLCAGDEKTSGVQIKGIDPELENRATSFNNTVKEGSPLETADMSILLGKGLADFLGAGIGDTVVIISQAADGSMADALFRVRGIVDSGDEALEKTAFYIHIDDAQRLFALPGQVHEIAIVLPKLGPELELAEDMNQRFQKAGLSFEPWQVIARVFYLSMQTKLDGSNFSTVLILLIIAIGTLNTVLMTVLERTKEYGVLRAIGTSPGNIVKMVMIEVVIMAVIAIILGSIIGFTVISILAKTGIDYGQSMDFGGITIRYLYPQLLMRSFTMPGAILLIMSALSGIIPALRASRIQPAKALRTV